MLFQYRLHALVRSYSIIVSSIIIVQFHCFEIDLMKMTMKLKNNNIVIMFATVF